MTGTGGQTFTPGGAYTPLGTTQRIVMKIEDQRKRWLSDYLKGFAQSARDIAAGKVRQSFGSFAITGFASGYQAGVKEAGHK